MGNQYSIKTEERDKQLNLAINEYCNSKCGINKLAKKYKISIMLLFNNLNKLKLIRTKSEACRLTGLGRKLSQEIKDKISKSRIDYLKKNPDKVPYKLNHYSKGESYPEKYFRNWLEKENILYQQEVNLSIYRLDFLINNIDLEIDGEQHYLDKRIKRSNKIRNNFVKDTGYKIIRIRWSKYQKLTNRQKNNFLISLKNKLIKT